MADNPLYEDKELFNRIAGGDEGAFGDLYYRYLPRLVPFIREITKSELSTEELIQDVFVRVWLHRDRLTGIVSPRAWLYKIASGVAFNYLHRKAIGERVMAEVARRSDHSTPEIMPELTMRELQTIVNEAIIAMPDRRRQVYELSRREGLSIEQIAGRLGLSPNTVRNTLGHALAFIRERLENSGYILPALILSWML
ncbi:MAG: RNA polymerase sigma-70 factor [Bacteroidota bacterium]|nr:RNA polymerase sigma-70 factor [Bacteroidota bacterium]MDP4217632.1 RNA polymerase sigma-70 factor [Bacteroidota bacterium]MDP4247603.1 RNA polymerase sigma-70 factor [Bacteroidota bacterium]MDP4252693.1 RNA polymerase sigma-70 factor [Bacteroidota bacterium]MDP4259305.1 RNA polymerase sigma-70 factor [Bacteroidota bacterium]